MATTGTGAVWGWKAIADHVGVSVRTAQRWAAEPRDPLPVYVRSTRVFSTLAALDGWTLRSPHVSARPVPARLEPPVRRRREAVGGAF